MLKLMFIPFRLAGGLLAGLLASKLFERIWRLIDKEQAPHPEQREISIGKLAVELGQEAGPYLVNAYNIAFGNKTLTAEERQTMRDQENTFRSQISAAVAADDAAGDAA